MSSLSGKTVLITGCTSGIGKGAALCFAETGAKLVIVGRRVELLAKTKQLCIEKGAKAENVLDVSGDLTDSNFRSQLVQKCLQQFRELHVLINSAGVERLGSALEQSAEEYMRDYNDVFSLNLTAVVDLTKKCIPHLIQSRGNIINVSSICSTKAWANYSHYCMSKAALDMFTKCMAVDSTLVFIVFLMAKARIKLGSKGVRVNSINPGEVETEMLQRERSHFIKMGQTEQQVSEAMKNMSVLNKIGEPREIGKLMIYLASDDASFVTGSHFVIDGGLLLK